MVFDSSNNVNSYDVQVEVTFVRTEIESISAVTEVYEGYVDSVTGLWVDESGNGVHLGTINAFLKYDESSSTVIRSFSNVIVEGAILLDIDYLNLLPRTYTLVLEFTKASYQNHTLSLEITVLAHELDINIEFEDELIPNNNFTIEISVKYMDEETSGLGLNSHGSKTGAADNIPITVNFDLEYENGSQLNLEYNTVTGTNGIVHITLSGTQTNNLQSILGIGVTIKNQGTIKGKTLNLGVEEIPPVVKLKTDKPPVIKLPLLGSVDRNIFWIVIVFLAILALSPILYRYLRKKEIEFVKLSENLEVAGAEIKGIQSIQQMLIINNSGLPLYVKQIQSVGVDPLLLSGMSSAVSSFLQEVADQQYFGIQVLENQGLSITSHKREFSNFIIVSTNSLPTTIMDQMKQAHALIENKYDKNLKRKFSNQFVYDEVNDIFNEVRLKIDLTENLVVNKENQKRFENETSNHKELKLLVSLLIASEEEETKRWTLKDLIDFYRVQGYVFNKAADAILTAYNYGILQNSDSE
jgi:hypothetical protein